jgi:hypothetical protein
MFNILQKFWIPKRPNFSFWNLGRRYNGSEVKVDVTVPGIVTAEYKCCASKPSSKNRVPQKAAEGERK